MILVTGGTGLVGAHLLYNLCTTGNNKIVALHRTEHSKKTTIEIFELHGNTAALEKIIWRKADITNIPDLAVAFKGITHVYHAAAMVSFRKKDADALRKINIEGTANIVNICLANNIKKLCYVSSIATLDETPGKKIINEENDWNPEGDHSDYSISKFGAEIEVWRGSQEGLDVVIVNPGVIFGFGAWKVNTSQLFSKIKNGFSFYTQGSVGVVAVQDVVTSMVKLMNSSISKQRFILVSDNKSYQEIFGLIAKSLKVKPPSTLISPWMTHIAWRVNSILSFITFGAVDLKIYKYTSKSAHTKQQYQGTKITEAINFTYTSFEKTIDQIASKLS